MLQPSGGGCQAASLKLVLVQSNMVQVNSIQVYVTSESNLLLSALCRSVQNSLLPNVTQFLSGLLKPITKIKLSLVIAYVTNSVTMICKPSCLSGKSFSDFPSYSFSANTNMLLLYPSWHFIGFSVLTSCVLNHRYYFRLFGWYSLPTVICSCLWNFILCLVFWICNIFNYQCWGCYWMNSDRRDIDLLIQNCFR